MEDQKKIPLLKMQESYKLTVTEELEKKIRFLCDKLPRNEWSGTLFYSVEGSFSNRNLHIIAKDFFLQDVGGSVYTEFKDDIDLAAYIAAHEELLDCYTALLHSHHVMATQFSGTDMETLREEGVERNHFLSLIVNNIGEYTAKITRKVTCTSKGINTIKYNTFDDVSVEGENNTFESEDTYIEYYPLDIIVEEVHQTPKTELELRLEEVKANANSYINKGRTPSISTTTNSYNIPHIEIPSLKDEEKEPKQLSLWEDLKDYEVVEKNSNNNEEFNDLDMSIAYDVDHINPSIVDNTISQVITGDIFSIYKQNIDLNKWVNNMEKLYDKRFANLTTEYDSFQYWVDTFIEFLENEVFDADLYKNGRDYMDAIWAYDVIVGLQDYPKNKYLDTFIESFKRYLI